jgi:hypothetical protein
VARTFHVYPKAYLKDGQWRLVLKIGELGGVGDDIRSSHFFASAVTTTELIPLPKVIFRVEVADTEDATDIEAALLGDTVRIGPDTDTLWGHFQRRAEARIATAPETTERAVRDTWRLQDVNRLRRAARDIVEDRGWTVVYMRGE